MPNLDPGDVGATAVGLVARVKAVLLAPSATWPVIAAEPSSAGAIYGRYVAPLAAIGVIAAFIGQTVIGYNVPLLGHMRTGIVAGLGAAVLGYLLSFVSVFVIAWLVDVLAPTFGGQRDPLRALKLTAYSYTAAWVAGILQLVPALGVLALAGRMLRLVPALSRLAGADALSEGKIARLHDRADPVRDRRLGGHRSAEHLRSDRPGPGRDRRNGPVRPRRHRRDPMPAADCRRIRRQVRCRQGARQRGLVAAAEDRRGRPEGRRSRCARPQGERRHDRRPERRWRDRLRREGCPAGRFPQASRRCSPRRWPG